jgi:hypothetical protein
VYAGVGDDGKAGNISQFGVSRWSRRAMRAVLALAAVLGGVILLLVCAQAAVDAGLAAAVWDVVDLGR